MNTKMRTLKTIKVKIMLILLPLSIASLLSSWVISVFLVKEGSTTPSMRYFTLVIIIVLGVLITGWVHALANVVVNPIAELNKKLNLLNRHFEVELSLDSAYKNAPADIHALYDSFSNLSMTFNFASNALSQKNNETLALLNYADSYQMFKGKNEKAMGICMNNIGNIHYRAKRYDEAAKAYEEAVNIATRMLEKYISLSASLKSTIVAATTRWPGPSTSVPLPSACTRSAFRSTTSRWRPLTPSMRPLRGRKTRTGGRKR
ncbi:MAG: tetratricopeptide repeat protein [Candidatus Pacebacteria bacterium]|nr:tetratricopeptide repeat protein [Candidatus Paceibacterota bacterium]